MYIFYIIKLQFNNNKSEDTSSFNDLLKINNDQFLSSDINKINSGTNLEKIILKNKVNKIIKIYRNYHKKKRIKYNKFIQK